MNMIMEIQEMQQSYSSLPVLARLDRLDRWLLLLEEKHSLSGRRLSKTGVQEADKQEEDKCKTLSSALDEVQHKGTLMERLAMLENRVLQLSLDMDERNTSKSSSTVAGSEKLDPGSESSTGHSGKEKQEIVVSQGMQSPLSVKDQLSQKTSDLVQKIHNTRRRQSKKPYNKLLGWLRMGCQAFSTFQCFLHFTHLS